MRKNILLVISFLIMTTLYSCSKKTSPNSTPKTTKAPKEKLVTPKVIVVNDVAAKKTVDGRYYYDLNGKRYWRNNNDGKYYLFNKSMYNDPDFKGNP